MGEIEKLQGPAPDSSLDNMSDEAYWLYRGLHFGLTSSRDPVTVRTLLVDAGRILGVDKPDWNSVPEEKWDDARKLMDGLLKGTHWEVLKSEYLVSLGVELSDEELLSPIKLLVANGRHKAEPLWEGLTRYVEEMFPGMVGLVNPVGHYNDGQPRIAGPRRLLRKVDTFAILGSTQIEKGGSLEILSHTARLIRNVDFSTKIDNVAVVIPFFGGSRGHREGQRKELVYEIMETISIPKILGLPLMEAKAKLWWDVVKKEMSQINPLGIIKAIAGVDLPKLKIVTVDIHNEELPARKFIHTGIEFINADPTPETAKATLDIINDKHFDDEWVVMASDGGAISRTEKFAEEILKKSGKDYIFVGNMDKTRYVAGETDSVRMGKMEKWWVEDGVICKEILSKDEVNNLFENEEIVLMKSDDMIDTGGTNKKDEAFLRSKITNIAVSITIATHPVFSKGCDVIDEIGSDYYVFTNTLIHNGLSKRKNVRIVSASPAIARALDLG